MRDSHVQVTSEQLSHERFDATNRANFASFNGGRPAMGAVSRPMTTAYSGNHAGYDNRPAYNNAAGHPAYNNNGANNGYRAPANNNNANNGYRAPAYNNNGANNGYRAPANNNNANNGYRAPANNEPHYTAEPRNEPRSSEPAHQNGGEPHNEAHPNNGGGEHGPR